MSNMAADFYVTTLLRYLMLLEMVECCFDLALARQCWYCVDDIDIDHYRG